MVDFRNSDPCDERAERPCPGCGGTQYDWGAGTTHRPGVSYPAGKRWPVQNHVWFINWHCYRGCGRTDSEEMTNARLMAYRSPEREVRQAAVGRGPDLRFRMNRATMPTR